MCGTAILFFNNDHKSIHCCWRLSFHTLNLLLLVRQTILLSFCLLWHFLAGDKCSNFNKVIVLWDSNILLSPVLIHLYWHVLKKKIVCSQNSKVMHSYILILLSKTTLFLTSVLLRSLSHTHTHVYFNCIQYTVSVHVNVCIPSTKLYNNSHFHLLTIISKVYAIFLITKVK